MKVHELIAKLQEFPADHEVVMSKDSEGNGFSPISEIDEGVYVPYTSYGGEVHLHGPLTDDLIAQGFTDEDLYDGDDGHACITLWPMN